MATKRLCSVEGCGKHHLARGFCSAHYRQHRLDPQRPCSINGCDKPARTKGFCTTHYARVLRHGSPLGGGTTPGAPRIFYEMVVLPYKGDDCLLWPFGRQSQGYGAIKKVGSTTLVHRLACEAVHGPPPTEKHEAAHSCGKGHLGCVNPRHTRWATRLENMADTLEHNTRSRGTHRHNAKLNEEAIRQIRQLLKSKKIPEISKMYSVSEANIYLIAQRRSWAWVGD